MTQIGAARVDFWISEHAEVLFYNLQKGKVTEKCTNFI